MIEQAAASARGGGIQFIHQDGPDFPFAAARFDAVLTVGVLQYIRPTDLCDHFVNELRRVVKPGGMFVAIEQASLRGMSSGTVEKASTPDDYCQALVGRFAVEEMRPIRTSEFSRPSQRLMKMAGITPDWAIIPTAARAELYASGVNGEKKLKAARYYDARIVARPLS